MKNGPIPDTCLLLALLGLASPLWSKGAQEVPIGSLAQARTLYEASLESFLRRDWAAARQGFLSLDRTIAEHPKEASAFDHVTRGFSWVDLTDRLAAIPQDPAAPIRVHKMLVLLAAKSGFSWGGRNWHGGLGASDMANAKRTLAAAGLIAEALSGGRIRLEGEVRMLEAAVTGLFVPGGRTEPTSASADHLQADPGSLVPYPAEVLVSELPRFDTLVLVWDHAGVTDGRGSYATAYGSIAPLAAVPGFLYGPRRGLIILSKALMDRPGTLVHEWFHVAEDAMGISPVHGYLAENRSAFQEWTGHGEFDYYGWHLTGPAASRVDDPLDLKRRYPSHLTRDHIAFARDYATRPGALQYKELLQSLQIDHAAGHHAEALAKAETLVALGPGDEGGHYWRGVELARLKRVDRAIAAFTAALDLDPASARSHVYRGQLHGEAGRGPECVADFKAALDVTRAQADYIRGFLQRRADRGEAWAAKALRDLGLDG